MTRMTVAQIMVVTVVFAILFIAGRPLWPGIRGILAPAWELWRLLAASLACGLGLVVGFGRHRWLARGGLTLSAMMPGPGNWRNFRQRLSLADTGLPKLVSNH